MSNGDIFPSPTNALPLDSGGQDRSRVDPIYSEVDPGAVGAGRVWVKVSTGAANFRNATNTGWVSFGGIGVVPGFGLVGNITAETIGATASAGASGLIADASHRHAMPAAGAPAAEALGSTQVTGAAGTFADSAHVHAMPAKSVAVPLVASGAGSAGTSNNPSLDDHVHPAQATGSTPLTALTQLPVANYSGGTTSFTLTPGTTLTAGKTAVILLGAHGRGGNSITQTNVVWTQRKTFNGNSLWAELWTGVVSASAGATATVALTGSDVTGGIIFELASLTPTAASAGLTATGASGPNVTSGKLLTNPGDVVAWVWCNNNISYCLPTFNIPMVTIGVQGGQSNGAIGVSPGGYVEVMAQQSASAAFAGFLTVLT